MAFENETVEVIHGRMLNKIRDDIDKRQGSVVYDLTMPAASELAQAYIALDNVLRFSFASEDMPGEYLDLRAAELGVYRRPSVKATGKLTFTGDDGIVIEVGTRVSTDDPNPVYFVTTESGTITNGSVTVNAEAEEGGVVGNVSAGEITIVLGDLAGVVEVTNEEAFEGGVDEESDESLLDRYFDRVRKPITSGNIYHYEQWAREVPGVGDVRVYPVWNGPGTVKVVIIDDQKRSPAQSIIDAVVENIERNRPMFAEVTVVGAEEVLINIDVELELASDANIDDVRADIERGIVEYLASLAFTDPLIRYTRIASIILDIPRVIDYSNLKVNGVDHNIELIGDQIAVLGEVNIVVI